LATNLNLKNAIDTDMQQNMSSMLHVQQSQCKNSLSYLAHALPLV
jgi:hypothetical protein